MTHLSVFVFKLSYGPFIALFKFTLLKIFLYSVALLHRLFVFSLTPLPIKSLHVFIFAKLHTLATISGKFCLVLYVFNLLNLIISFFEKLFTLKCADCHGDSLPSCLIYSNPSNQLPSNLKPFKSFAGYAPPLTLLYFVQAFLSESSPSPDILSPMSPIKILCDNG